MAEYPIDKILATLNQASIQQKQPAVYEAIKSLIQAARANQLSVIAVQASNTNQGNINTNMTFLTATDETATLLSSRMLAEGTGIDFDLTVAGVEKVGLEIHPFLLMGA